MQRRGYRSTFLSIISESEVRHPTLSGQERRNRRDELLCYRHYYYVKMQHLQYQFSLQRLAVEFYISESRIVDIMLHTDWLKKIREKRPDIELLRKKYPHLVW